MGWPPISTYHGAVAAKRNVCGTSVTARTRNHPELQEYYRVTRSQRTIVAVLYFGLAILLVLGMEATHLPRDVLR